jgi:hypothetical protein
MGQELMLATGSSRRHTRQRRQHDKEELSRARLGSTPLCTDLSLLSADAAGTVRSCATMQH